MKKLVLFIMLSLFSCTKSLNLTKTESKLLSTEKEINKVTFLSCGDNLIHHTVYKSSYNDGYYDFKPILKNVKSYISAHDLAFINQETILGGSEIGLSTYPRFNSPYEVGDALIDSGFNLISLANNHTLDRGLEAINNSLIYWKQQQVIFSGSEIEQAMDVKLFTKNGIKFAFVAYTYGTNGIKVPVDKAYLVNLFTFDKAINDLNYARQNADVVIVSMHWGAEYYNHPNSSQIEQAQFLNSLGVDIIVGHHPHVIQPFDIIEANNHKTYVVYSLGNFLSDQTGIDRLIGMMFSLDISKNQNNIIINNPLAKLFYTYKNDVGKFENIFFSDLADHILPDYAYHFARKKTLIQEYNDEINVI